MHISFKNSLTSYCQGSGLIVLERVWEFFLKEQSRVETISLPCLLLDTLWLSWNPPLRQALRPGRAYSSPTVTVLIVVSRVWQH